MVFNISMFNLLDRNFGQGDYIFNNRFSGILNIFLRSVFLYNHIIPNSALKFVFSLLKKAAVLCYNYNNTAKIQKGGNGFGESVHSALADNEYLADNILGYP